MNIIKYFFEEPASLEAVPPPGSGAPRPSRESRVPLEELLSNQRYYRGYLAGTDLDNDRVGFTAIVGSENWLAALLEAFGPLPWWDSRSSDPLDPVSAVRRFASPSRTSVLMQSRKRPADGLVIGLDPTDRRAAFGALRPLLEVVECVALAEPAHDGFDWSFYSSKPMMHFVRAALATPIESESRRFIVPFQKARSEAAFYFERWQLAGQALPGHIEEL